MCGQTYKKYDIWHTINLTYDIIYRAKFIYFLNCKNAMQMALCVHF